MSFTIKQGRFEGPYYKLLELIESHKLSINEISLASIADEYVAYIKSLNQENNKDDLSQFIVVASTLMLIKAKSLLPAMQYSKEEATEVANLEYKLSLYKTLISATKAFKDIWSDTKIKWSRDRMKIDEIVFTPGNIKNITLQSVSILTIVKLPHLERLKQVAVAQAIKIEHVIEHIKSYIDRHIHSNEKLNFKNLIDFIHDKINFNKENKNNLYNKENSNLYKIVGFLAILDMIRNGLLDVEQSESHGDITLWKS